MQTQYSKALVQHGFDGLRALQLGTLPDFLAAGLTKGHALQLLDVWESGSSSSSSSSSGSSSSNDST
jgi:hypothetical protein